MLLPCVSMTFEHFLAVNVAARASALPHAWQVYNTGRSLGQFISLLTEKAGKLALPDVLITAVGTKVPPSSSCDLACRILLTVPHRRVSTVQIFLLDCQSRGTASNAGWREDRQWARTLDHGWDLGVAKQARS